MIQDNRELLRRELLALFQLKKTERIWHIPVLAALCVGIPLLIGLLFDKMNSGLLASLPGIVILYLPSASFTVRMRKILLCSIGFLYSFAVGLLFSFNPYLSIVTFALFAGAIHFLSLYFKLQPPGSFFFVMLAAVASNMPFDLSLIPERLGLISLGTLNALLLAFFYSLWMRRKYPSSQMLGSEIIVLNENPHGALIDASVYGVFMLISMGIGHALQMENPYWVPISCAAVMQGGSTYHIWQRSFHRILGTFIGVALCWGILTMVNTALGICIAIIALQFVIEMLVVRQYALAVIFITPMTILLTEAGHPAIQNPNELLKVRLVLIAVGSVIGALGGWITYHERTKTILKVAKN